jgi:hypothetical protein
MSADVAAVARDVVVGRDSCNLKEMEPVSGEVLGLLPHAVRKIKRMTGSK